MNKADFQTLFLLVAFFAIIVIVFALAALLIYGIDSFFTIKGSPTHHG